MLFFSTARNNAIPIHSSTGNSHVKHSFCRTRADAATKGSIVARDKGVVTLREVWVLLHLR